MPARLPLLASFVLLLAAAPLLAADPVSFRQQIAPLLVSQCLACHGPRKAEGGYRIDAFERVVKAGDSGTAGFEPGKPDESEALRRLLSTDKEDRMPKDGEPLPAEQIALVRRWIEEGAKFDGPDPKAHLATIVPPPVHPDPPEVYPHPVAISALAFSADGSKLFAGGYHEITVWNAADGQMVSRIKNIGQRTYRIAPNADGSLLLVAGGSPGRHGEVRIIEAESGNLRKAFGGTSDIVYDAAFDPAGNRVAAGGADATVRIFDASTGDPTAIFESHSDWITALTWSGDGTKLATASRDKTAKVFDVAKKEPLITYSGHNQPVRGIAFTPDGNEVYTSGGDFKVHRWKVSDGKKSADVASFDDDVYKLVASGEFLFAPSADKSCRQFQLANGQNVRTYKEHSAWLLSAAYHPGTKRLATGAFNGEICVWNADDGSLVTRFVAMPGKK